MENQLKGEDVKSSIVAVQGRVKREEAYLLLATRLLFVVEALFAVKVNMVFTFERSWR